jgi:hypothetical protein
MQRFCRFLATTSTHRCALTSNLFRVRVRTKRSTSSTRLIADRLIGDSSPSGAMCFLHRRILGGIYWGTYNANNRIRSARCREENTGIVSRYAKHCRGRAPIEGLHCLRKTGITARAVVHRGLKKAPGALGRRGAHQFYALSAIRNCFPSRVTFNRSSISCHRLLASPADTDMRLASSRLLATDPPLSIEDAIKAAINWSPEKGKKPR